MRTSHVLIPAGPVVVLAGAILSAALILKPVPVEQVSQAELQRREEIERWLRKTVEEDKLKTCVASTGKTLQTLDRNDPQQEAVFRKCMWPEESRDRLRQVWDKILGMW